MPPPTSWSIIASKYAIGSFCLPHKWLLNHIFSSFGVNDLKWPLNYPLVLVTRVFVPQYLFFSLQVQCKSIKLHMWLQLPIPNILTVWGPWLEITSFFSSLRVRSHSKTCSPTAIKIENQSIRRVGKDRVSVLRTPTQSHIHTVIISFPFPLHSVLVKLWNNIGCEIATWYCSDRSTVFR